MTEEKAEMLSQIKIEKIHFAYDRYEDKDLIEPKFETFRTKTKIHPHNLQVYVLCGDREKKVRSEDLHRIIWLRDHGYAPYVMLYDKEHIPKGHELRQLQRWVNNRFIFWKTASFEEYKANQKVDSEGLFNV